MSEDRKHAVHRVYINPNNGDRPYLKTETPDYAVAKFAFERIRRVYTPPNADELHTAIWNYRRPTDTKAQSVMREQLKKSLGIYDITEMYQNLADG